MVRDVSMASLFGDHPAIAAFMIAFRFSHFLRRVFGEGALQSVFIPHYEELKLQGEKKAQGFFFRMTVLLGLILFGITVLVEGICGIASASGDFLRCFAWMFPSLIFICLYGLNLALLQCKGAFFLSSAAPCVCNVIWIGAIFFFRDADASRAVQGISMAVLGGFAIQWLMTCVKIWPDLKGGMHVIGSVFTVPAELKSISKATLYGLIGVIAVQLNSVVDLIFARFADAKGPVYLWYAIRLQQLPFALVGLAAVYSIVPSLSRTIKAGQDANPLQQFGVYRIYQWVVPCIFATWAMGFASVNLLFGRGQFSLHAVLETTWCLAAYTLALLPATLTAFKAAVLYAHGNFKAPMWVSLISVVASMVCNALFVFMFGWGAISIAISTSVCAGLNCILLNRAGFVREKIARIWPFFAGGILALCASLGFDYWMLGALFYQLEPSQVPAGVLSQATHLLCQLGVFAGVLGGVLYVTGALRRSTQEESC